MADATALLKRINKAKEKKLKRESELQEAYRYVLPTRDTIRQKDSLIERGVIYDSTAKNAIEKYATKLQNLLTPAWEEWLKIQPGSDVPEEEVGKLQEILDKVSKDSFRTYSSLKLLHSRTRGILRFRYFNRCNNCRREHKN
jgi:hypothetical protein